MKKQNRMIRVVIAGLSIVAITRAATSTEVPDELKDSRGKFDKAIVAARGQYSRVSKVATDAHLADCRLALKKAMAKGDLEASGRINAYIKAITAPVPAPKITPPMPPAKAPPPLFTPTPPTTAPTTSPSTTPTTGPTTESTTGPTTGPVVEATTKPAAGPTIEPAVSPQPDLTLPDYLTVSEWRLAKLSPRLAEVGYASFKVSLRGESDGDAVDKPSIGRAGKTVDSIFAHAPSKLIYDIPEGVTRFTASARCLNVWHKNHIGVRVSAGAQEVFVSNGFSKQPNASVKINVQLPPGAKQLILEGFYTGEYHAEGHVWWEEAEFKK